MKRLMVRYRVKPERAAEYVELVRAVSDELHGAQPAGLRYATFQLADGVSFVRLVETEDEHDPPPRRAGLPPLRGGYPRTLRRRPGRGGASRNRLLPALRRLRHGSAQRPGSETRRETHASRGDRDRLRPCRQALGAPGGSRAGARALAVHRSAPQPAWESTNVLAARLRELQQRLRQPMSATPRPSDPCSQASEDISRQRAASKQPQAAGRGRQRTSSESTRTVETDIPCCVSVPDRFHHSGVSTFTRRPSPRRCWTLPAPVGSRSCLMLGGALANPVHRELGRATPSCRTS